MLTENFDDFHDEKAALLQAGIKHAQYLQTDDTKVRHAGSNGYFMYAPKLLHQGEKKQYMFNSGAVEYMEQHKLAKHVLNQLEARDFESRSKETLVECSQILA